jgi:hypothetical protein
MHPIFYQEEMLHDIIPPHQLGFRRMLAAIYIHTSGHIVAAPMAHYMAINSSRFLYSHDTCHLPVHAMDTFVKDKNMVMTFRKIGGKQVVFHQVMNYYHRNPGQDKTCFYQFFSEMDFITTAEADNQNIESFDFTEEHPGHDFNVAVFRISRGKKPFVPVFPWHWLGSTMLFTTSLLEPVTKADPDYQIKEEYAYKCMLLFLPFRSHHDLILEGSYQLRWQQAHQDGLFSDSMIEIAENIQTIHNSLASSIPPNELNMETILEEDDEEHIQEEAEDSSYKDILARIGDLLASTSSDETPLTEETNTINPNVKALVLKKEILQNKEQITTVELNSVIEFSGEIQEKSKKPAKENSQNRFFSEYSTLNTLSMQHLLLRREVEGQEDREKEKKIVNATGTWQSIVHWGENAKLDAEQQTAFEMLVATYVLTFYDEARADVLDLVDFPRRKEGLCQLARKSMDSSAPLRLLVTGPAGAGKCECIYNPTGKL